MTIWFCPSFYKKRRILRCLLFVVRGDIWNACLVGVIECKWRLHRASNEAAPHLIAHAEHTSYYICEYLENQPQKSIIKKHTSTAASWVMTPFSPSIVCFVIISDVKHNKIVQWTFDMLYFRTGLTGLEYILMNCVGFQGFKAPK
jgi:hypothetical protein